MKKSKKGFTLIELLIVIAIMGVLAVAFLPSLLGAPKKARDTQRIADLEKINKVLINADLTGVTRPTGAGCIASAAGAGLINFDSYKEDFGGVIPSDPQKLLARYFGGATPTCTGQYYYKTDSIGNYSFVLLANVENNKGVANTTCSAALGGNIAAPPADTPANNLCYAILTKL